MQEPPPQIPPKAQTTILSKEVLDSAAKYKRQHLGDFIYDPVLKPQRLLPNTPIHRGFSSNPKPLPWDVIKDKINSVLTVKVPRVHLSPTAREEITARGFLWGTDVYTDDSDVVAACIHGGWIRGEWNDDVDLAMLDLDHDDRNPKRRRDANSGDASNVPSEQLISSPPASGPMPVPADRDLHVNVVILPKLVKYGATTRFGISSREFGGEYGTRHVSHDGLSFMIQSIRWVENGAQPQARLRGKARRERMRKAMHEVRGTTRNISGPELDKEMERLRSGVSGNWRRKETAQTGDAEKKRERAGSEGDKENRDGGVAEAADPGKDIGGAEPDKDVEMGEAMAPKETAGAEGEGK